MNCICVRVLNNKQIHCSLSDETTNYSCMFIFIKLFQVMVIVWLLCTKFVPCVQSKIFNLWQIVNSTDEINNILITFIKISILRIST